MGKESNENKVPFKIKVAEHEKFDHIMDAKYMTAHEFCTIVSSLLKTVYADYEGCKMEFDPNRGNMPYISLHFNHSEPKLGEGDWRKLAISRDLIDDSNIKSDTVRRIRAHDNRNAAGDRYYLTEDGKSGIVDFLHDYVIQRNGKINWGSIVAEVSETQSYFNQQKLCFTKVSLLDPAKLATRIYGETDDDGIRWEYAVDILRSTQQLMVPGTNFQPDWIIRVMRVSEPEVRRLCNMLGVSPGVGLNIVR